MKFVDLSHPISNKMSTYPSDPGVSIVLEKDISTDRTLLHSFKMGTHTGAHLDVPAHIIPGGRVINDFPLSSFSGHAVKVNVDSFYQLETIKEKIDGIVFG